MDYFAPTDLKDALAALAEGAPSVIAGGTDWYPAQGERPQRGAMLDISRVSGLRGIIRQGGAFRIGATATWSDVIAADLPAAFDGLKAAAREVGSVQIQNAGTVAGNLCNASPAADGVPPLLSLGAQVELASVRGTRTLDLAAFLTGVRSTALASDELVTGIFVPDVSDRRRSAFVKLGARKYLVISIAMVAVTLDVTEGRILDPLIAVGSCSPVAVRLRGVEAAVRGCQLDEVAARLAEEAFEELAPIDDVRGTAGYRRDVVLPLIERAIMEAAYEH